MLHESDGSLPEVEYKHILSDSR